MRQDTVGFPLGFCYSLFFFIKENFPIDGPLWEVRQMVLLMFGEDTRVAKQNICFFVFVCVLMFMFCDDCKNVSICTKT